VIHHIYGDVLRQEGNEIKFIVHVCNDIGKWGAGFTKELSKKWKTPELMYKSFILKNKPGIHNLGKNILVKVEENIYVVNMICQHNVRNLNNSIPLKYNYLEKCLNKLAGYIEENKFPSNVSIHMPKIGSGLAGGDWNKIEGIIRKTLDKFKVNIYILL